MNEDHSIADARALTADIVASYVTNNSLRSGDLPELIASVYDALLSLGEPAAEPSAEPLTKPVSIKKSIHNDYLISMEDGKQYQSLKRHLSGRGLTPADYRAKWDLPPDYPMTASAYSERRAELARSFGLGHRRSRASAEKYAPVNLQEAEPLAEKPKRGRKKAEAPKQAV